MRDLVAALALAALPLLATACAPDADSADPADAVTNDEARALTDTFVTLHPDQRRCAAPRCGGFNVAWANHTTTVCADGRSAAQCYVASIDLAGTHFPDAQQSAVLASLRDDAVASATVLRGRIVAGAAGAPGRFVATDVFRTADPGASSAALVFANASNGCTFQPCAPSRMSTANSSRVRTPAVLDFTRAAGTDAERDLAQVGATSETGVLVRGTLLAAQTDMQRVFRVSQYYLHVTAAPAAPVCGDAVQPSIAATTDRLLYSSESDYPFDFFSHAGTAHDPITAARVLTMLELPAATTVEIRTMDAFFSPWTAADTNAPLADQTVATHYRALRRALESNLTDLQVFRVGTIQIRVLVIGHDACGNVVGVSTTAIET